MTARCRVLGRAGEWVSACDRGLLYGDGLFETLRVRHGRSTLWSRHMQRLTGGCERLHMPLPDIALLAREVHDLTRDMHEAVVRITWTRGCGVRGYRPPDPATGTGIITAGTAPSLHTDWSRSGIRVRFCRTRLALQPALAGLKHLNRLEQVLARGEWDDPDVAEGLMCDTRGRVVCATAANLFVRLAGVWHTPALDDCGVAGVARAVVLDRWPGVRVAPIEMETLMQAEEMFLSSSVRGILPIRDLAGRRLPVGKDTQAMREHLCACLEPEA